MPKGKKKKRNKRISHGVDLDLPRDIFKAQPYDEFIFECTQCGDCCKMGRQFVMLDTRDVFNLSRHFKKTGNHVWRMDELLNEYTTPMQLTDFGYPIFTLNAVGAENECVFLRSGKCSVQDGKPYTCRAYPITIGPGRTPDDLEYYICTERSHHFNGRKWQVRGWLSESLTDEDLEFLKYEYSLAVILGKKLRRLSKTQFERALFPLLLYKYYEFDVDAPLMRQYISNMEKLLAILEHLAEEQTDE